MALPDLFSPILLYAGCAIGAIGVCLALPRRGMNPQVLGGLVAAIGLGAILLGVGVAAGASGLPNVNFYLFSAIALGAGLRVISHPRPVYAALYFILTILASSGLYLLLSAEFMAFALIIVYAGAILITYLFVIMLATETPTADEVDALSEYDRYSREPVFATAMGFLVVAVLATLMGRGAAGLAPATVDRAAVRLGELPGRVEPALRDAGVISAGEHLVKDAQGNLRIDTHTRVAMVATDGGETRNVELPAGLDVTNTEGVAFELLQGHPGAIEAAGVILLMAMLGAVVLARKKVEMDERARRVAAQRHLSSAEAPVTIGGGV